LLIINTNNDTILKKITIAIDGFSSTGKSTLAKQLAKHLEYVYVGNGVSIPLISYWTTNNPQIRKKDDMDVYPDETLCPFNIYNLWIADPEEPL
jgi:cytidylate kinase